MATLSAPIATSFNSLPLLSWLATAYLIATAASQPLCGKLTDIYSRRTGMLVANVLFGLGNLACGMATERWMMIGGRVLAGIGGGALNTIGTIIISDYIPLRQRGVWQGVVNLSWGIGNGLGGVFGGYCYDTWNWNLAFLSQIPLSVICATLTYVYVDRAPPDASYTVRSSKSSIRRVDFLGSLLLVTTMVVLMLGLNSGAITSWTHPLVITSFVISALSFCVFVYVEEKVASEPIIPIRLMFDRTVASGCLTNLFYIMIVYDLIYYVPIYFRVRGLSNTDAGAALIPYSIFVAAGSLVAGVIVSKSGKYKYLNITYLVVMVAATITMSTSTLTTSPWLPLVCMGVVGAAIGALQTVALLALISAVEHPDQAVVTSLSYAFRSTGTVMGVALASAVFQKILRSSLWARFGDRNNSAAVIGKLLDSLDEIDRLPAPDRSLARDSYMHALTGVFSATVVLAFLGLVSGLLIRELKLHTTLSRDDAGNNETDTMAH